MAIIDRLQDNMGYQVIYADPPWDYRGGRQHTGKGGKDSGAAVDHYPHMTQGDLEDMNIGRICAKDAILFLWTTSPQLAYAMDLISAWGFKYKTVGFVWDKKRVVAGCYTMSQCEICLIATRIRGKIPQPRGIRNARQLVSEKRRRHSEKPDSVRDTIMSMFPTQKKIELFARSEHTGWDCWGNEL